MITGLKIRNLQGIESGELSQITPLTILVGPNGSGKSTILRAIEIGAGKDIVGGVKRAVFREKLTSAFEEAKWLITHAEADRTASIEVDLGEKPICTVFKENIYGGSNTFTISFEDSRGGGVVGCTLLVAEDRGEITEVVPSQNEKTRLVAREKFLAQRIDIRYIEPYSRPPTSIEQLYVEVVQQRQRVPVAEIVGQVIPGFRGIEILPGKHQQNKIIPYIEFPSHSIPLSLAGDGIRLLLRLTLELATLRTQVALIEEPEVHLHPAAMRRSARAIVSAVMRGVQVILTTHSLEMIDSIIAEVSEDKTSDLTLFRLMLPPDGQLKVSRLNGADVRQARTEIETDLR